MTNEENLSPFMHGLRHKTLFNQVSSITELTSHDIPLPRNITFADGINRAEKYDCAVNILLDQPHINAVVILEPPRPSLKPALSQLYNLAVGKRLRTTMPAAESVTEDHISEKLRTYLHARNNNLQKTGIKVLPSNDNISPLAQLWHNTMKDCSPLNHAAILQSTLVYVPEYSNGGSPESFINTHIDHLQNPKFDVRIVECVEGSGTILFDDADFKIPLDETARNAGYLHKVHDTLSCWALARGSSAVLRGPSSKMLENQGKPCIHAHGIGGQDTPESRLTIRHDLTIV